MHFLESRVIKVVAPVISVAAVRELISQRRKFGRNPNHGRGVAQDYTIDEFASQDNALGQFVVALEAAFESHGDIKNKFMVRLSPFEQCQRAAAALPPPPSLAPLPRDLTPLRCHPLLLGASGTQPERIISRRPRWQRQGSFDGWEVAHGPAFR